MCTNREGYIAEQAVISGLKRHCTMADTSKLMLVAMALWWLAGKSTTTTFSSATMNVVANAACFSWDMSAVRSPELVQAVPAYNTSSRVYGLLLLLPRLYSGDKRIDSAWFFGFVFPSAVYLILQAKLTNWIAAGRKRLMLVSLSPIMWALSYLILCLPSNHVAAPHQDEIPLLFVCVLFSFTSPLILFLSKPTSTTACNYAFLNIHTYIHDQSDYAAVSFFHCVWILVRPCQGIGTRSRLMLQMTVLDTATSAAMESAQLRPGLGAVLPFFFCDCCITLV